MKNAERLDFDKNIKCVLGKRGFCVVKVCVLDILREGAKV